MTTAQPSQDPTIEALRANLDRVVLGKGPAKTLVIVALLAEGHVLIEDVPGTGKTTLARALAQSIDGAWRRIQFTPDLLPADVTGSQIYRQTTGEFLFHRGPVFANIVLADEINRASPKTQAAMLEVMEERQVTSDGHPYPVDRPFVVIATQNPVEQEGTYRLPEAQLDRFMLRTGLGYLDVATERDVLVSVDRRGGQDSVDPVMTVSDVAQLIGLTKRIHVDPAVAGYVAELSAATRGHSSVHLGVSTRGSVSMVRAARALAMLRGQRYVSPDEVKELIEPVYAHRLILTPEAEFRGVSAADILREITESVGAPVARGG